MSNNIPWVIEDGYLRRNGKVVFRIGGGDKQHERRDRCYTKAHEGMQSQAREIERLDGALRDLENDFRKMSIVQSTSYAESEIIYKIAIIRLRDSEALARKDKDDG